MPRTPLSPRELNTRGNQPWSAILRNPALIGTEALAGAVTVLALIPEVISFSIIAGVDPVNSLVASAVLAITMSFLGGRPAMVTAAAGSVALVVAPLVHAEGVEYLLPTVILAGLIQIVFGVTGLARLMRYIPRSVMIGFVNALGILIFVAQIASLVDVPWQVYPLFVLTLLIIWLFPKLTTIVPAPLVAIVAITAITVAVGITVPTVGDEGHVTGGLPGITPFAVPFTLDTLLLIAPTAIAVAFVGLIETLLTAKLVDDMTDSPSSKKRESWGLGVANILSGLWGGVAGCAMIGQTVVNVKIGRARTRLSTLFAGVFLLLFVAVFSSVMAVIPMVALAAVMMVVAVRTVDWHSVRPSVIRRMPRSETIVMVITVATVVVTSNLAIGVGVGAVLAALLLLQRASQAFSVTRYGAPDAATVEYRVRGALFFASSNELADHFFHADDPARVIIDLSESRIWDASSVAALDAIETKYAGLGSTVEVRGLDERSARLRATLSGHLNQ
ncbi:SulP family sulfate permease [Conyzicola lurida]|uniref:SulP family sulfate permease n=1 Tax=Conyzicola lurida TaxID=1172621 RepID=A0A841AET9_9MICO|nr:SulP family sulfate permease [Conyzicola lurida]